MLQSQIINALPRRVIASLWATQETRISLSHLIPNTSPTATTTTTHHVGKKDDTQPPPPAISSKFLSNELPIRFTHILRLLSTLSPTALQSPIIKNVSHSYLRDICTLLHPSLQETSPKAFSKVIEKLQSNQATNLIRLKYALLQSNPTAASVALMENISTISLGIHLLLDQHISWGLKHNNHAQKICPEEIAHQAVADARKTFADILGDDRNIPSISIINKTDTVNAAIKKRHQPAKDDAFYYVPSVLHRILYESTLLSLRAKINFDQENQLSLSSSSILTNWLWWKKNKHYQQRATTLKVFGGPTSIGFRLDTPAPLIESDLLPGVPKDPIGIPTCSSILSSTSNTTIEKNTCIPSFTVENVAWESLRGWRPAQALASHFGGHLDAMTVEGLGSTIYLALDRDISFRERYPNRMVLAPSAQSLLRHHRRTSSAALGLQTAPLSKNDNHALSIQAASMQLDAFLYAISDSQSQYYYNQQQYYNNDHYPLHYHQHHSVSLTAAVGHA
ncbi:hypothetical protein BDF20DRAFT_845762 [Mycotypha africana]|uniref:uncharacterized protein n=1 Tax=Mycotypha africana TaxID=64632 RepID=UPI002301C86C|nr:uncharacterized protein BDF20DRAFT_845762 [Mycotypha africana]KAI8991667.1 hypothetical protein BDF20DRAFT_845762 [Mycotypha africana]